MLDSVACDCMYWYGLKVISVCVKQQEPGSVGCRQSNFRSNKPCIQILAKMVMFIFFFSYSILHSCECIWPRACVYEYEIFVLLATASDLLYDLLPWMYS